MTDVLLTHTPDGGEITIENGRVALTNGIETAVYLSLFGGNEEDSGAQGDDRIQWWGNLTETDPARIYRSETQHLLRSIPAIPANLRRIEGAVGRDLAWMAGDVVAAANVTASMPGLNRIHIDIQLELADGRRVPLVFEEAWGARDSE